MATFRHGDRVKLKGSENPRKLHLIGCTGTFVRYEVCRIFSTPTDCVVIWDDHPEEHFEGSGYLEPIQPERNRIVAWETLPIDPRKVLEGVS